MVRTYVWLGPVIHSSYSSVQVTLRLPKAALLLDAVILLVCDGSTKILESVFNAGLIQRQISVYHDLSFQAVLRGCLFMCEYCCQCSVT